MRDIITGQTPEGLWFAQDGDIRVILEPNDPKVWTGGQVITSMPVAFVSHTDIIRLTLAADHARREHQKIWGPRTA